MTRHLHCLASAALMASAPALAAERSFTITGFDQIRVAGPYKVRVTTGVATFARATGSTQALDGISLDVNGQSLTVRRNPSTPGGYPGQSPGPVEIELGTHDLRSATVVGSGSVDVSAVRGLSFNLTVEGAGSARVGAIDADQAKVSIAGTGSASLAGSAKSATLIVRGVSSFDGSAFSARDAVIGGEGPSSIRLSVTNSAKINVKGAAQVVLEGAPACTISAEGSATVSGCQ